MGRISKNSMAFSNRPCVVLLNPWQSYRFLRSSPLTVGTGGSPKN